MGTWRERWFGYTGLYVLVALWLPVVFSITGAKNAFQIESFEIQELPWQAQLAFLLLAVCTLVAQFGMLRYDQGAVWEHPLWYVYSALHIVIAIWLPVLLFLVNVRNLLHWEAILTFGLLLAAALVAQLGFVAYAREGWDLSGHLTRWKRRYANNRYTFNDRVVWCTITQGYPQSGGAFSISASAFCNDPTLSFSLDRTAHIYASRAFPTSSEAEKHLDGQLRRAARQHPDTRFYQWQQGVNGDYPACWDDGKWQEVARAPSGRHCSACTHEIETHEDVCPRCGELVLT